MDTESLIFQFAEKQGWKVVRGNNGSTGSYWIKGGRYRMASIEPKKYGWLIGLGNSLFNDVDNPDTCYLTAPNGRHRSDRHKHTRNFWEVTNEKALIDFLLQ